MNGTLRLWLPAGGPWQLRLDGFAPVPSAAPLFWAGPPCPAACSAAGRCDAAIGLCACDECVRRFVFLSFSQIRFFARDGLSAACSVDGGLTTQWIVVVAIVCSIAAAVIIAWIVRCCRERSDRRLARYEEI